MDIDAQLIHVRQLAFNILSLEGRRINPAAKFLIVKVSHAAVGIGRFQDHRAIHAFHLVEISLRINMGLKIDYHKRIHSRCARQAHRTTVAQPGSNRSNVLNGLNNERFERNSQEAHPLYRHSVVVFLAT